MSERWDGKWWKWKRNEKEGESLSRKEAVQLP
jgi:hypothetical protein